MAFLIISPALMVHHLFSKDVASLSFDSIVNLSATDNGESTKPKLFSVDDNVYVVWEDNESGAEEILFTKSADNGRTFSAPSTVITTLGDPRAPNLVASDTNEIYVVVSDDGEILLLSSSNGGESFSDPVNISNSAEDGQDPKVTTSGEQLLVTWVEEVAEDSREIFLAISSDSGASFAESKNLSNSSSDSTSARVYAGDRIYVVWQEDYKTLPPTRDVFISYSIDEGQTFSEPVNLSESLAGIAAAPQIAVSGSSVFVVWVDLASLNIFLATSTDGGESFSAPENLSSSNSVFSPDSYVVTYGSRAHFVWTDEINGLPEIFLASADLAGNIIGAPINVSNSSGLSSLRPQVTVSNADSNIVYVLWRETTPSDIFVATSRDGGLTFGTPVNLSSSDSSALFDVSTSDNHLYVVWEDTSQGQSEIMYRTVTNSGPPSIAIDSMDDPAPRWELDPVSISGTVNGNATDSVTIDWGDGEIDTLELNGSSWGPVSHTYNSSSTGAREILVELRDELGGVKSSDSTEVTVKKHATSLILNDILSVVQGNNITIRGQLIDTDSNDTISEVAINFTGTGVSVGNVSAITEEDGNFLFVGPSPDIVSTFSVQAHFNGDISFEESHSDIIGYDTVAENTTEFAIPEGTPSGPIDLVGFNVSLTFENISSGGSVFVSDCSPSTSARYITLEGTCVQISPAVRVPENSSVSVTISYDPLIIPVGYSQDDVSIFHESVNGIIDITESRRENEARVSGRTSDFSKFLLGVALHDEPQLGAETLPVFVGTNDLSFIFTEVRHISFQADKFNLGDTVNVQVTDGYANLHSNENDNLNATIVSTSDPSVIILKLQETGFNTGTFIGTFTLTSGTSSNLTSQLHAERNDQISGFYNARVMMPLRVMISDVIEAGLVKVTNANIPAYLRAGPNLVDVYDVTLVDARLGPEANVTVIMSYASFPDISDPLQLAITTVDETDCFDVISLNSTVGFNESDKRIYGYTTTIERFALVRDDHIPADRECFSLGVPPGGSGGGVPQPGSIIVIDALAAIAGAPRTGGGGGSGSHFAPQTPISNATSPAPPSSGSEAVSAGENSEVVIELRNGTGTFGGVGVDEVKIRLHNVTVRGSITVMTSTLGIVSHLFASSIGEHAYVSFDGTNYTTVGEVYDFESSSQLEYHGTVDVTIPYDEELIPSANVGLPIDQYRNETDIRLLHHNGSSWEDVTIALNTTTNTVTGRLTSGFSPVVAALSNDGTFDEAYFVHTGNQRLLARFDNSSLQATTIGMENHGNVTFTLKNLQRINQTYVFIVQIVDADGIVQYLNYSAGTLDRAQQTSLTDSFTLVSREYTIQMFVLDNLESPALLSSPQMLRYS